MSKTESDDTPLPGTDKLPDSALADLADAVSEIMYRPAPHAAPGEELVANTWRVRFDLPSRPGVSFGLDINGEVMLGRGSGLEIVDLSPYEAADLGVSRHHLMLRPTPSVLYAIDMGSTNGSLRNGQSIGVNTPYNLVDGDTLTLGRLQLIVRIISRPVRQTALLNQKADLTDALAQVAKAITSQVELDQVLNQVTEAAMSLTEAGEVGLWLVDERSGDLFLEAQRGIDDDRIQRLRIPVTPDTLAGQVVQSGKPIRATRQPGEEQIKLKTDYLVEALLYVPITIGGVTCGVMAATQREDGQRFSERDEHILTIIADFAAIAIQNARLYKATDTALARRVQEIEALNELARTVSSSLDLGQVFRVLVEQGARHWPEAQVRLWLLDEEKQVLTTFSPGDGDGDSAPEAGPSSVPVGRGIVGQVAKRGRLFVSDDIHHHPDYSPEFDDTLMSRQKPLACVPLAVRDRVVGVLALANPAGSDGFTAEDIQRLQAFANPLAAAIANARLYAAAASARAAVQATARALPEPLIILDEQGRPVVANPAAQRLIDTHMGDLFEGISASVGRTSEVTIGEQTFVASVQDRQGVGTIAVMQDITYVKQLERDRAEFMRALSHDLKSPLTSIKGYAQLAGQAGDVNEKGARFLDRIILSAEQMLKMINTLLDTVAISDAGRVTREPCDLAQAVRRAVSALEGAALGKSITLSLDVSGEERAVLGDGERLYHAALNLIENAIKYSPEESRIEARLEFGPREVALRVIDEGPGIPLEDMPHIFERYYRGKNVQEAEGGSGLGLSVVKAVARAHDGQLTVENRPGGGAQFMLTLPASLYVKGQPAPE